MLSQSFEPGNLVWLLRRNEDFKRPKLLFELTYNLFLHLPSRSAKLTIVFRHNPIDQQSLQRHLQILERPREISSLFQTHSLRNRDADKLATLRVRQQRDYS